MIDIDYNESVVKKIGGFGFEVSHIVGTYDNEHFKVLLSYSPRTMNNNARCIEGELTEDKILNVLSEFDHWNCQRETII